MANASAKRIAAQNDQAVRNLRLGMLVSLVLSLFIRLIFRRSSLPPSLGLTTIFIATFVPSLVIYRYLLNIGTSKRDPSTGELLSPGEDLNQPGVTEWCFDVLYITWLCQFGSAAFGEWFWWTYLIIPFYASYKIWGSFISPMFFGKSSLPATNEENAAATEGVSKRQQKLRKRGERGDPRVRTASGKN